VYHLADAVVERMRNAMVDFGGYRIHFRDRENEARVFLGEALRYVGIRIYLWALWCWEDHIPLTD